MRRANVGFALTICACLVASCNGPRHDEGEPTSPDQANETESELEAPSTERGVVVRGVVRDCDTRRPVPGARVIANLLELALPQSDRRLEVPDLSAGATTNAAGRFELGATPVDDRVVVWVLASGYAPYFAEIEGDELADRLDVSLDKEERREFRIEDEYGAPVAGAHALLYLRKPGPDGPPVAEAWSATDGTFRLSADNFGLLAVVRAGYVTVRGPVPFFDDGTIVLQRAFSLSVGVQNSSGEPVQAARVLISASAARQRPWGFGWRGKAARETGPDGMCAFTDLPFALWDIEVAAAGFATAEAKEWSGAPEIVVTLRRTATVSGEVRMPDGSPAAGARIDGDATTADSRGRFRVEGLRPGPCTVWARLTDELWGNETIELREGEQRTGVVVRLAPGGGVTEGHPIRVRVVDWEGHPMPGMAIRAIAPRSRPKDAVLDPDGSISLPDLPLIRTGRPSWWPRRLRDPTTDVNGVAVARACLPLGSTVDVRAFSPSWEFVLTKARPEGALAAEAEAVVGQSEVVEVRLPRPVQHTFVVRGPSGEELPSAIVELSGNARRIGWRRFLIDPNGKFDLAAWSTDVGSFARRAWRPAAGTTVTDIRLMAVDEDPFWPPPTTVANGRVVARSGRPVGGALVTTIFPAPFADYDRPATATHRDGTFELPIADDVEFLRVTRRNYGARIVRASEPSAIVLAPEGVLRVRLESRLPWNSWEWRIDLSVPLGNDHWHTDAKRIRTLASGGFYLQPAATGNIIEAEADAPDSPAPLAGHDVGEVRGLGAGPLRVRLWSSGFEQVREVRIEPGVTTDVTFRLP